MISFSNLPKKELVKIFNSVDNVNGYFNDKALSQILKAITKDGREVILTELLVTGI